MKKRTRTSFKKNMRQKFVFAGGAMLLLILPLIVVSVQKQQNESTHAQAAVSYPTIPTAQICTNTNYLSGPTTAPIGAIVVPAGDNSSVNFSQSSATYWFAPGIHTLGTGQYSQIVPGNNSTFVGAPGAILDGQGKNRYAITGNATGVTVKYLTIQNFGLGSSPTTPSSDNNNEGVVNHNAGHNWTIQYNTVQYNAGAGVFVGTGDNVQYNCLTQNGQYGFSAYEDNGVSNVNVSNNEISFNNTYDWESHISGCGCTGGGKFWATTGAIFNNNYVHHNHSVGMWADTNNTGFDVEGNYISDNFGEGIIYETSYNALFKNNNFVNNAWGSGKADAGFPHSALYLSESGSDSRVSGSYGTEMDVIGNNFTNNWGGVILWENSDRYCSSSANTSSGTCTLVNPNVATITTCANANLLKTTPYINDCRWKTQNVKVSGNSFNMDPSVVGTTCTEGHDCGFNGIFSQYGSYAPYTGWVVAPQISNTQNNTFFNNTYTGTWHFMGFNQNESVSFSQWQAGFTDSNGSGLRFNAQDAGSTFNGTVVSTVVPGVPTNTPMPVQPTATPQPVVTVRPTNIPTATPIPPVSTAGNVLDSNTAGFEGSLGKWSNWYATSLTRTTSVAHSGSGSLQVKVTAPYGWGIQLSNWPGFAVTPGQKTISFWALKGTNNTGITMQLQWISSSRKVLKNSQFTLNSLSSSWQKAQTTVTAPDGTAFVNLSFVNNVSAGTIFYLDDISVSN